MFFVNMRIPKSSQRSPLENAGVRFIFSSTSVTQDAQYIPPTSSLSPLYRPDSPPILQNWVIPCRLISSGLYSTWGCSDVAGFTFTFVYTTLLTAHFFLSIVVAHVAQCISKLAGSKSAYHLPAKLSWLCFFVMQKCIGRFGIELRFAGGGAEGRTFLRRAPNGIPSLPQLAFHILVCLGIIDSSITI